MRLLLNGSWRDRGLARKINCQTGCMGYEV